MTEKLPPDDGATSIPLGWTALILLLCGLVVPFLLYPALLSAGIERGPAFWSAAGSAPLLITGSTTLGFLSRCSQPGQAALVGSAVFWMGTAFLIDVALDYIP